ncbi:DUF3800 domain-containing protein [Nocardia wallacei]|uniref:DUF3800 domain-containing protein n=1 Tax=Nocardia wallacei TaxID=480035 RepID=UPI002453BBBD|nr:DUF3800 domain-containing protein [Nocardia wallacei]
MLLAYIDETYKRGNEFWVSALVCPADSIPAITAALDEVVKRAAGKFPGVSEDAELHGYELDGGSGHWEPLKGMARARVGVFEDTIDTIAAFDELAWFRAGVIERKVVWGSHNNPHEWSLKFLLERIDRYAGGCDQHVLCICDEVQNRDVYRQMLQHYRRYGTGGNKPSKLPQIADTLHFAPSCHSRMVQAVDMVTYVLNRIRHPPEHPRAAAFYRGLWERLEDVSGRGSSHQWP